MIKKGIEVKNAMGLHARPAALVAQTAGRFAAEIKVSKEGVEVNAKSIMGLMMLAAPKGSILVFTAEGEDEKFALEEIEKLFLNGFSEAY